MQYKVSVIVPNYNHAPYLDKRIDSILSQTYKDFELILLDDCSTDNSKEIIEKYANNEHVTHVVYNEYNSGSPFYQWRKGVDLARGEWIWIAESDDWSKENYLEVVMTALEKHNTCGIAYTLAHMMRDGIEQWELKYTGDIVEWKGKSFLENKLLYGNVIYNVSMVVFRKDIFKKINHDVYDTMRLCGDWMIYSHICSNTNVLQIDAPYSYYRMHGSNTSSNAEKNGKTFLEGLKVLEYIKEKLSLSSLKYSRHWGRMWYKYQWIYSFPLEINSQIKKYTIKKHFLIFIWYQIYYIFKLKNNRK